MIPIIIIDEGKDINARCKRGNTALHVAVMMETIDEERRTMIVKMLLGFGADVNQEGEYKMTPLHWAAQLGRRVLTNLLEAAEVDIDKIDGNRATALHLAARHYVTENVVLLLEYDANICAKDGRGRTPLHEAVTFGQVEVVKILTQYDPKAVEITNSQNETALHIAAASGQVDVVNLFTLYNPNAVKITNSRNETASHIAAALGHPKVVRALLEAGSDINARNVSGHTANDIVKLEKRKYGGRLGDEQIEKLHEVKILLRENADRGMIRHCLVI